MDVDSIDFDAESGTRGVEFVSQEGSLEAGSVKIFLDTDLATTEAWIASNLFALMNNKLLYIKEATIEELLSGSSSFGNNIDLIIEVYTWLFDAACGSCPSKFIGYINRIKTYQMETKCDYKLKGNFQVTVSALGGKTMSNHNITNVMAEAFLSTNPTE